MSEENLLETKVCGACNKLKVITSFHRVGTKRLPRCKQCKLEGKFIPRSDKYNDANEIAYLRLFNTTKSDYIQMYELFESMGYDLKKDIHTQFCEKYNLPVNNPKNVFEHYISPQDCFDF